jgi:hypothetical protein
MFNHIYTNRGAKDQGKSRGAGLSTAPTSSLNKVVVQADAASYLDVTVDDTIRALDSELSGLGCLQVAQAAKERGWATLQRELERHPVRPASPALLKGAGAKGPVRGGSAQPVLAGHSRAWRVALSSAGVAVVILAVLLGTYSAGLFGTGGNGDNPVAVVSVSITEVSQPDSTASTGGTGSTTRDPDAIATTESTGTTTGTTESTTTIGSTPGTTHGTTPTTGGSTHTSTPPTTKPAQTTTTNEQQMAAAEREKDAKAAALDLGQAVLYRFSTGDMVGLPAIADSAQARLTQLIASLDDPQGVTAVGTKTNTDGTIRITLEFKDVDDNPRFFITVRVDDGGATITAISGGS